MDQPIFLKALRIILVIIRDYKKCYNVSQLIYKGFKACFLNRMFSIYLNMDRNSQ